MGMPKNNPTTMVLTSNPAGIRRRGTHRWFDQVGQNLGSAGRSGNRSSALSEYGTKQLRINLSSNLHVVSSRRIGLYVVVSPPLVIASLSLIYATLHRGSAYVRNSYD